MSGGSVGPCSSASAPRFLASAAYALSDRVGFRGMFRKVCKVRRASQATGQQRLGSLAAE